MRVTVLGASGFLGRAICKELVDNGIYTIAVSRQPLAPRYGNKQITVSTYGDIPKELVGTTCIHLATPGTLYGLNADQAQAVRRQSTDLLRYLVDFGFSKIVFASSAAVYGDELGRPAAESDPTKTLDAYAELKKDCENLLQHNRDIVARIANVFGSGMSELNVLSDLLKQIPTRGEHKTVYELRSLSPVRDYIAVEDVARAFSRMVSTDKPGTYNLGSGIPRTVGEVATLLLNAAGVRDATITASRETNRPSYLVLNPAKAARDLQWHSEYDIQIAFEKLAIEHTKRENP